LSSRQAGSWMPAPRPGASERVWSRPPSTATTASRGTTGTSVVARGSRNSATRRSRSCLSRSPTSWAIRPTCRPLRVTSANSARDSAASSKEPPRAAARTTLPRIAGETLCESSRTLGRSGERIPATGRAVTDRFVIGNRPAADLNGPRRLGHRTGPRTLGTGLVIAEASELGPENFLDRPLDDGLSDVDGQGLDGIEVEVESRPSFPVGTPGDDSSPTVGQIAKRRRIVGLTLGEWHGVFVLELGERGKLGKSP
jgi:hypothetical protein